MELPAAIAAEQGLLRQNVALSVIKQSADQEQAIAQILEQAVRSAPVSSARGTNVDLTA
ncbi:MAG: hypothetical protein IT559_06490 [Alphaproteobacteria bacterium]|nr:hypothetical protein [Alphaproteobacteria bacterium]